MISCWLKHHRAAETINILCHQWCRHEIYNRKSTTRWTPSSQALAPSWKVYCWTLTRIRILIRALTKVIHHRRKLQMVAKSCRMICSVLSRHSSKNRWVNNCLQWRRRSSRSRTEAVAITTITIWWMEAQAMVCRWWMEMEMATKWVRHHCVSSDITFRKLHRNKPNLSMPAVAPPPKAAVPRRSAPIQNNNNVNAMNNNSSQDLFGSMPFGSTASTPFDVS